MGYYLETPVDTGKAAYLCEHYGAVMVEPVEPSALPPDRALVCVVANPAGGFEAAGYCHNDSEFEAFARRDARKREWLLMDRATVERLSQYPDGD